MQPNSSPERRANVKATRPWVVVAVYFYRPGLGALPSSPG